MFALQSVQRMSQAWSDLSVHLQTSDGRCGLRMFAAALFVISQTLRNIQITHVEREKHFIQTVLTPKCLKIMLFLRLSFSALIFHRINIWASPLSINSTFKHLTLVLIDVISIIRHLLIEYGGTSSDSFNHDMSFCASRSWASVSTVPVCCESTAAMFFKPDFTC